MNTKKTQSATQADIQALAIKSAADAFEIACLGMSCVQELRAVLRAVVDLSEEYGVIHELAKVGLHIADDRHNILDCEREDKKEKLAELKGVIHA